MTEIKKKLEQYKNNNCQTHTVALRKLCDTSAYQRAFTDKKKIMTEQKKHEVMQTR